VFVVIEHGTRRLLHLNVTRHPSAAWTLQQLREVAGLEHRHRFLLHDRDSIFSAELDRSIGALGMRVLKSAPRSPRMNAVCKRVIGTIRREWLDWLIPLSEAHLRTALRSWVQHYNRGRPHMGWVQGFRIRHLPRLRDPLRAIAAENFMWFAPIRSSEDFITSTHLRPADFLWVWFQFLRSTAAAAR